MTEFCRGWNFVSSSYIGEDTADAIVSIWFFSVSFDPCSEFPN